jgi:TolB-like protein
MQSKKPGKTQTPDSGIPPEEILEQLNRILSHPEFQATPQQRDFLRFVVTETLEGREHQIKGYTVATQVLGRKPGFDPKTDPAVSIQASRLRKALERYSLVAGGLDPIRIEIPKGTYVPVFHVQEAHGSDETPAMREAEASGETDPWPTVLVRPFRNLTGDPEQDYIAAGLASELAVELSRYQDIRVWMHGLGGPKANASDSVPRFVIEGSVHKDTAGVKVAVHLIDTSTGTQILGDMHRSEANALELVAFQEEIARVAAVKVAGEHGIIAEALSSESRDKPPSDLTTHEAILRYYQYDMAVTGDTFLRAFEALEAAVKTEPECGQVWTMLGRLYTANISLEHCDIETPLDRAVAFTEKGVLLNPASQRARTWLAFARMLCNQVPAALAEAERALALNPNSLFFMDILGYLLSLLGEWERGPALLRKAIRLNPYYRPYVHYGLWGDFFRREEYEQAYTESLNFRMTGNFWEPLAQAATLGQLGRIEEGRKAAEILLKLKPDFPSRGRVLIGHFAKFEELLERMVEGLHRVGVDLT